MNSWLILIFYSFARIGREDEYKESSLKTFQNNRLSAPWKTHRFAQVASWRRASASFDARRFLVSQRRDARVSYLFRTRCFVCYSTRTVHLIDTVMVTEPERIKVNQVPLFLRYMPNKALWIELDGFILRSIYFLTIVKTRNVFFTCASVQYPKVSTLSVKNLMWWNVLLIGFNFWIYAHISRKRISC